MKPAMSVLGIDMAKRVFHAVGMEERGKSVLRKRLPRNALMPFIAKLPPMLIGMEACGGAHDWARRFREPEHEVKLMVPQCVKPYVKSNKNDTRDAAGMSEAVTRLTMRFVPIKELDQQDIQALHRVCERLIGARTALVNEVHGLLNAYGIVVPKGGAQLRPTVVDKLESETAKLMPLVAYPLAAANVLRPLPCRLRGGKQPVMRTRYRFSRPRPALWAWIGPPLGRSPPRCTPPTAS
jgi:transposase